MSDFTFFTFEQCFILEEQKDEIIEVEYGYYPQQSVPRELQEELEEVYKNESVY